MRPINKIILHCTAGPQDQTVAAILDYWERVMKWKKPGYHHLISPDGTDNQLLPISEISNGVAGHNHDAIHISYIGGVEAIRSKDKNGKYINIWGRPVDNRTPEQIATMYRLVSRYQKMFPHAEIKGHRDYSPDKNRDGIIQPNEWMKACPSFEVKDWLIKVGLNKKNCGVETTADLNLRRGAGTDYPIITVLPKGTAVEVLNEAGGWSNIKVVNSQFVGWVSNKYLS